MQFSRLTLNAEDPAILERFYKDMLGMRTLSDDGGRPRLGYDEAQCGLCFQQADMGPYTHDPSDFYWKIGLTVRNLDHAVAWLTSQGWPVTAPRQFRDIGYMSKVQDPGGFVIELLQQGFEGREQDPGPGHPIGGQAIFAHITLRVTDIARSRAYCEDALGLRLMSIQPVTDYGFCLYFYTWSSEPLPDPDLTSVSNREWLWARPTTILELQHLEDPTRSVIMPQPGYAGLGAVHWQDADGAEDAVAFEGF
ncbi:VOC family protein [Coralliovum pocilloporae]|uniref:VOC family protein n=1 Tax=Coralliovum pocilloporae TaxID=3066369 RepID=UPI003306E551